MSDVRKSRVSPWVWYWLGVGAGAASLLYAFAAPSQKGCSQRSVVDVARNLIAPKRRCENEPTERDPTALLRHRGSRGGRDGVCICGALHEGHVTRHLHGVVAAACRRNPRRQTPYKRQLDLIERGVFVGRLSLRRPEGATLSG